MALSDPVLMPDAILPPDIRPGALLIRPTTSADLPEVLSILDEAAAWLQTIGITEQWPPVVSADAGWVTLLNRYAAQGRVQIAELGEGIAVGVFLLLDDAGDNDRVWSREEATLRASYLYRLAVRRFVAGSGVAAAMLDRAFELSRARGGVLRLDCWAGNHGLRRYYLTNGFEYVGDVSMKDRDGRFYSVSRFQRTR